MSPFAALGAMVGARARVVHALRWGAATSRVVGVWVAVMAMQVGVVVPTLAAPLPGVASVGLVSAPVGRGVAHAYDGEGSGGGSTADAKFRGLAISLSGVPSGLATPTTVEPDSVAANTADKVTNVLISAPRQLQAKFKHAADFGVTGNYSKANGAQFNAAIQEHINAAGTQSIRGTYRGDAVTHFVDPQTGLNVISRDGTFVSGWRLNPDQLANVLRNGSLGGG